ncbi:LOW QUALITY PROTEIN: serine/threonine-protein kinase pim-3-like [Camarhynchus parvulus]|uniref:LOW QUALITY PROTEIN: serine/threonine-protein kinase pim-3-like n=1 Tax=Geospiza parvula TaxID=87175 RepID=UPI001237EF92|nr:LOW QUALITY PROTEIN: serine/threonine-protein kinase pim-3-like [Camarhynchus parvulus]
MDSISQVIRDCETCVAIKQAKRLKPLWYGGRWSKYKYGEAWQIDYITLPQTRQARGGSASSSVPGQKSGSAVPPAWVEKPLLEQLYREGPLLGSGGCGSVYSGTRLADGAPLRDGAAIKRVSRERISERALLGGALVPLELALLWKVSRPGFRGVVRLLDWFEVPDGFALLMERPQRCQDLWYFLHERRFLTAPVARGLFRQVLEAVRRCSSRGVPHRHIKAENVLVDLATGEAKLIDFGCGTILQGTFYTRMSGEPKAGAQPGSGGSPLGWQRGKREGRKEGESFFSQLQPSCFWAGQGLAVVQRELAGREGAAWA